jgi:hypothetical protein
MIRGAEKKYVIFGDFNLPEIAWEGGPREDEPGSC